ncbi:MAG: hypothetical protein HUK25_02575 [Treponema sp.]|nr:hypothetical protein [Treponema sp.]
MKYSELDLQIEDVMWFGIDKNGYVFEATSGGRANVPDFIANSKEHNEELINFFLGQDKGTFSYQSLKELNPKYQMYKDCLVLSSNGITCYDMSQENNNDYSKITIPEGLLNLDSLPENIQNILKNHAIDIDITTADSLRVKHAY